MHYHRIFGFASRRARRAVDPAAAVRDPADPEVHDLGLQCPGLRCGGGGWVGGGCVFYAAIRIYVVIVIRRRDRVIRMQNDLINHSCGTMHGDKNDSNDDSKAVSLATWELVLVTRAVESGAAKTCARSICAAGRIKSRWSSFSSASTSQVRPSSFFEYRKDWSVTW